MLYRCRLCEMIFRGPHHPEPAAKIYHEVVENGGYGVVMRITPVTLHACLPPNPLGLGVADFIGSRPC